MRRLILPLLIALLPAPLFAQSVILGEYRPGQATMSASLPVVIASNQTTVPVSISGTLPVSIAGTVAISAASLPLPSGAATETTLSGILTTEQSALTSLQTLDNIVLAEDGVHVSGESGVLVLGVRNDAGTALAADGDRIPLSIDSSGAVRVTGGGGGTQYTEADTDASITGTAILWEDTSDTLRSVSAAKPLPVTCATCSGTGVQHIDDAAFTPATDDGVPIFGMFDDVAPDSVNEGDGGVVRMSGNRNLYVQIRDNAGNERGLNIDSSGALAIGTVPSNMSVNIAQIAGSTASATNPLFVRPTDGTTAQTWSALDLDSGAGTVTRIAVGVAGAASGGPVAIPGTTANGLTVDVTRVQGTVTVDSELTAASALADATANPTVPAIAAYVMAYNGSTWDRARSSTITEATQDGALTIASTVGNVNVLRASTTAPTSVSANDDAVLQWGLRTGATVTTPFDSGGTDMTDTTNHAIKVNIVAGSAAGGTSSNFGSAFPGTGTGAGFSDGTNMQGARVVDADTGAGTAYTLLSNLVRRASGGPVELIGSSTSANSIPVVIASDQAAVTVAATNLSTNLAQVGGTNTVTGGVSGLLAVAGNVAHDAAVTANPLLMGGYASAAAPTDVSADGDAVRAWFLRSGAQVTQPTFSGTLAAVNNGAASAGTLRVTVANDSTGILASIGTITTSITPGTSAGHLGKAEDAAHSSGDTGVMILTKRTDSAATSAGTDGDYATLNTDASGRLWVNCATGCGGSGGTSIADNGAFTFGTTTITPAGGVFDDVATNAVTENSSAAFRMSSRREMYTQIRDAAGNERGVNVDSSNQMLVSAVVSSFPANQPFNLAQYGGSSVVTGGTAGTLGIAGIQAHDAAISGNNPILNGAYASAAVPTDVSADGDSGAPLGPALWCARHAADLCGRPVGRWQRRLGHRRPARHDCQRQYRHPGGRHEHHQRGHRRWQRGARCGGVWQSDPECGLCERRRTERCVSRRRCRQAVGVTLRRLGHAAIIRGRPGIHGRRGVWHRRAARRRCGERHNGIGAADTSELRRGDYLGGDGRPAERGDHRLRQQRLSRHDHGDDDRNRAARLEPHHPRVSNRRRLEWHDDDDAEARHGHQLRHGDGVRLAGVRPHGADRVLRGERIR
jgi:hypothetical protein